MRPLVILRFPDGPRVWLLGQRVHHGAAGCALLALSRRWPALAIVAAVLLVDDRHDWRAWFAREGIPAGQSLDKDSTDL